MIQIPITQGQVAIVCDCHAYLVTPYKWHAHRDYHTGTYYAVRKSDTATGNKCIWMHRVIMGDPKDKEVDHIDRNPLNNACLNLRLATHSENLKNTSKHKNNTSGFKGVRWHKRDKRWQTRIVVDGVQKHIGNFKNLDDAAHAYDTAALIYHGRFAGTNFEVKE